MHRTLVTILALSSVVAHPAEEKAKRAWDKETLHLAEKIVELYNTNIEAKVELSEVLSLHSLVSIYLHDYSILWLLDICRV